MADSPNLHDHNFEQATGAAIQLAELVAIYLLALKTAGTPHDDALTLSIEYQYMMMHFNDHNHGNPE